MGWWGSSIYDGDDACEALDHLWNDLGFDYKVNLRFSDGRYLEATNIAKNLAPVEFKEALEKKYLEVEEKHLEKLAYLKTHGEGKYVEDHLQFFYMVVCDICMRNTMSIPDGLVDKAIQNIDYWLTRLENVDNPGRINALKELRRVFNSSQLANKLEENLPIKNKSNMMKI